NPDEVFLVANFNIDSYWFLAFGVSDHPTLAGTGLWLSATSPIGSAVNSGSGGIAITGTRGGASLGNGSSGAFFWQTHQSSGSAGNNDTIQAGLDDVLWA